MRVLITAGPTREPIDPVRYLSNRSSGKMGYAIATAAAQRGHEVILVSGPVAIPAPEGVRFHSVETAREMFELVREQLEGCDAAVYCAAVSDYRPVEVAPQKIKKTADRLTLELEPTPDILGSCRTEFGFRGILMGFAAETENVEANARAKLRRKGCDFLVANDVSRSDIGFERDQNEIVVFCADKEEPALILEKQEKSRLGEKLVELLESTWQKR